MPPEVTMVRRLLPFLSLGIVSCTGGELPPDMEAVVQAINDATAATLVAAEAAIHVAAEAAGGACPAITREGAVDDFVVGADYGGGCAPDSGLVPVEVAGAVTVEYADEAFGVDFDGYAIGGQGVDGTLTGSFAGQAGDLRLDLDSTLDFSLDGFPETVDQTMEVDLSSALELDGTAATTHASGGDFSLTVTQVTYALSDITECPMPSEGSVVVHRDGVVTTVEYMKDGKIEVISEGVFHKAELCDFPSALF